MTLSDVSKKAEISNGFLSQVERGKTKPSIYSLKRITEALGVTMSSLFEDELHISPAPIKDSSKVKLVKSNERKKLVLPKDEIIYHLLTPDFTSKIEFILVEIKPGAGSGQEKYSHEGEECGLALKGRLELSVNNMTYVLEEGDSIYFPSNLPHAWKNPGQEPVLAIWAITPPSW